MLLSRSIVVVLSQQQSCDRAMTLCMPLLFYLASPFMTRRWVSRMFIANTVFEMCVVVAGVCVCASWIVNLMFDE